MSINPGHWAAAGGPGLLRGIGPGLLVMAVLAPGGCAARARGPGWTAITVADAHACAMREDRIYCWGENEVGALGVGIRHDHRYPLAYVAPRRYPTRLPGRGWSDVRAFEEATCGVQRGRLLCWGDGSLIEDALGGDEALEVYRHPVRIGARGDWRTFDPGPGCGLSVTGALSCFDGPGQRSPGDIMTQLDPANGWGSPVGGMFTSGAIRDGRLWLWGQGIGEALPFDALVEVPGARPWRDIAIGDEHACGIQGDELVCWGDNLHGQLGDATTTPHDQPQRVGNGGWTDVSAAGDLTCGIAEGALYCWGVTAHRYAKSFKDISPIFTTTPRLADPRRDWVAVEVSGDIVCGLRAGGRIACRPVPWVRVDEHGAPLDPAAAEPLPFVPPGGRRRGF